LRNDLNGTEMTATALMNDLAELGFCEAVFGHRRLYLAPSVAMHAPAINCHLAAIGKLPARGLGNRRGTVRVEIAALPPMFARRCRRGGMMRFLVSEAYTGLVPRPLRELVVTATARRRALPVVEPLGAGVEWLATGVYRGWFLTRALEGETLWQMLLRPAASVTRRQALEQARATIDRLHDGGVYHADLNFHNLFVSRGTPPAVVALDLDKARLYPQPLPPALRRANFARLERSARKLMDAGAILAASERDILGIGTGGPG
jgi:3-deoxy-D-manno-octulosonic acid kinase